eukprot:scaffold10742_cov63-Phaeocystis_antarctica.AAC.2
MSAREGVTFLRAGSAWRAELFRLATSIANPQSLPIVANRCQVGHHQRNNSRGPHTSTRLFEPPVCSTRPSAAGVRRSPMTSDMAIGQRSSELLDDTRPTADCSGTRFASRAVHVACPVAST